MKGHWVALVAAGTLVVGLVTGLVAGLALGLWAGRVAAGGSSAAASAAGAPLPRLSLEVFSDGCGVVRSEASPDVHYPMLTWVFRDKDGFQVLGRAAENETRYRYFGSGEYVVVLEAYTDGGYEPVSNEVTVTC